MNLKNQTVLITGSSRGIGRAMAFAFARTGANIVLNGSRDEEALAATAAELTALGTPVFSFFGDLSDYIVCQGLFQAVQNRFGTVDILINNAGISHVGLFTDMQPQEWQRIMDVNLGTAFNCTHLAAPAMVRQKNGVILNISSIWGNVGASCEAVYSASKGGMNAFTKALAKELGPSGIRVNAIACGVIDTQMNACFSEDERALLTDEIPLMRFGSADEVAALAVFVASDKAAYLTGQIITLDGGMIS